MNYIIMNTLCYANYHTGTLSVLKVTSRVCVCVCVCVCTLSHSVMSDSATPWTVAHQAPLFMGFSRWEHWSGLPFPSSEDLPNKRIEPRSPALQADSLPSEPPGKPHKADTDIIPILLMRKLRLRHWAPEQSAVYHCAIMACFILIYFIIS